MILTKINANSMSHFFVRMFILHKNINETLNHIIGICYSAKKWIDVTSYVCVCGISASLTILRLLIWSNLAHLTPKLIINCLPNKPLHLQYMFRINNSFTLILALINYRDRLHITIYKTQISR